MCSAQLSPESDTVPAVGIAWVGRDGFIATAGRLLAEPRRFRPLRNRVQPIQIGSCELSLNGTLPVALQSSGSDDTEPASTIQPRSSSMANSSRVLLTIAPAGTPSPSRS